VIPPANQNRLLVRAHGGGWLFMPAESGAMEAVLMSGFGSFKVISIDYRTLSNRPYPATLDDAVAAWKEAVKIAKLQNMAIFGTSTGGDLTLAMVLRVKDEGMSHAQFEDLLITPESREVHRHPAVLRPLSGEMTVSTRRRTVPASHGLGVEKGADCFQRVTDCSPAAHHVARMVITPSRSGFTISQIGGMMRDTRQPAKDRHR
jgi:hypothetical protein